MKLYHYTCTDHGQPGIDREQFVRPSFHWLLDEPLAWFTDLAEPVREALGLTSFTIPCDRTEVRYQAADTATLVPWTTYARRFSRDVRNELECWPALPRHWWVSCEPVPVLTTPTPSPALAVRAGTDDEEQQQ